MKRRIDWSSKLIFWEYGILRKRLLIIARVVGDETLDIANCNRFLTSLPCCRSSRTSALPLLCLLHCWLGSACTIRKRLNLYHSNTLLICACSSTGRNICLCEPPVEFRLCYPYFSTSLIILFIPSSKSSAVYAVTNTLPSCVNIIISEFFAVKKSRASFIALYSINAVGSRFMTRFFNF